MNFALIGLIAGFSPGCNSEKKLLTQLNGESNPVIPQDGGGPDQPLPEPEASPSSSPTPDLARSGILDPDCMSNSAYDTCIFYKNPVAQNQAALKPAVSTTSNLTSLQIYGVKLKGLNSSGYLENSSYQVAPGGKMSRVQKNAEGNWKYPFSTNCSATTCSADSNHKVGQLMAYYWLNHQLEFMNDQTGKFYAQDRNISVQTYSSNLANAYWDGSNIIMGDGGGKYSEFALGAEVYLHEAGHANLSYGATGTIGGSAQCSSYKGCIAGINEGQADYHAAMIFPEGNVTLGETAMNSMDGLVECGLPRGLVANRSTTAQQAYDACTQSKGEVHLMGRVYASVWWEVRSKSTSNPKEVDQLFTEHLKSLQNGDTFVTALSKIKSIDKSLFASKYSADFANEFARRGI